MTSRSLSGLAALLVVLATSANAAPLIERAGAAAAPISGVVVVRDVGGADIAYASGVPGDPKAGDTRAQTVNSLTKLLKGLEAQGFSAGDVVMMRVFLVGDPAQGGKMDFAGMNAAFRQVFGTEGQPSKPSRTTVQVAGLAAAGSLVEIEAQAIRVHR